MRRHFVRDRGITWDQAETLEQWAMRMFEAKLTKTPEFEAVKKWYGRDRLAKLYREYRAKKEREKK